MKTLKKLKGFFESNLDGYDVALAIIGSLFGAVIGTAIFWLLVKQPVLIQSFLTPLQSIISKKQKGKQ